MEATVSNTEGIAIGTMLYDLVREITSVSEVRARTEAMFPEPVYSNDKETRVHPNISIPALKRFLDIQHRDITQLGFDARIIDGKKVADSTLLNEYLHKGKIDSWYKTGVPTDKYFFAKSLTYGILMDLAIETKKRKDACDSPVEAPKNVVVEDVKDEKLGGLWANAAVDADVSMHQYNKDMKLYKAATAKANDDCRKAEDKLAKLEKLLEPGSIVAVAKPAEIKSTQAPVPEKKLVEANRDIVHFSLMKFTATKYDITGLTEFILSKWKVMEK